MYLKLLIHWYLIANPNEALKIFTSILFCHVFLKNKIRMKCIAYKSKLILKSRNLIYEQRVDALRYWTKLFKSFKDSGNRKMQSFSMFVSENRAHSKHSTVRHSLLLKENSTAKFLPTILYTFLHYNKFNSEIFKLGNINVQNNF